MTAREVARNILDNMNDEQIIGFISLFNIYNTSVPADDVSEREKAYKNLRKMIKPIPNLDYDKVLADYREEKYGA